MGYPSDFDKWECEIEKRVYFYGLGSGVAAHMLSILLSMVFINVLNEAARDADIFRMFSKGKGFLATVKCQHAFTVGCIADFIALLMSAKMNLGWEMVGLACIVAIAVWRPYINTKHLLYS